MESNSTLIIAIIISISVGILLGGLTVYLFMFSDKKYSVRAINDLIKELHFDNDNDDYIIGVRNGLRMGLTFVTWDLNNIVLEAPPAVRKLLEEGDK